MLFFLLSALRAIVEMLGLCLMAQAVLFVFAGKNRDKNPVYRFFALISRGPRQLLARCLPSSTNAATVGVLCFLLLFILWIALALLRKSL